MRTESASFFITGGTLHHDAPSYVERQADRDLLDGLLKGEFCYVLTSRQMGKSSLMVRTAVKLREQAVNVVALDLTAIGQNLTPEQWYDGLVTRMGRQLRLEDELEEFWLGNGRLGPCQRFFAAIRDVVLLRRPGPLVIFVDEIDTVRSLRFSTDEFFAAIRECYNRRAEDPELNRVAICLLGVATPSDLIRDTRTTPFNIGRRIELHDFTEAEAAPLARGLYRGKPQPDGSPGTPNPGVVQDTGTEVLLEAILFWTGGHPYLTQRFCRAIAEDVHAMDEEGVDGVCEELFLSHRARERDDNLLFVRERLLRSEVDVVSLLELYGKVWSGKDVADEETNPLVSVLRLAGIVAVEGGFLRNRNRIYAKVFDADWIKAHMPDAELRRQRTAFWRGVIRTSGIAAVVVAALTIGLIAAKQTAKARLALSQAYFSQARTERMSDHSRRRVNSLLRLENARPYYPDAVSLRNEAIASLALLDLTPHPGAAVRPTNAVALAVNQGLTRCAVAEADGTIKLVEPSGRGLRAQRPPTGKRIAWLAVSPDGRFVATQYDTPDEGRLVVWDANTQKDVLSFTDDVRQSALDFSEDGSTMAVGFSEGRIEVFALPSTKIASLTLTNSIGEPRSPSCIRLAADGKRLAESSSLSQTVWIWNLNSQTESAGHPMGTDFYHPGLIVAMALSADGERLATASENQTLTIWDSRPSKMKREFLLAHSEAVIDLAFSPSGELLASVGADSTLKVWRTATGWAVTCPVERESSGRLHFSRDGQRLGYAGAMSGLQIWDILGLDQYRVFRARGEVAPFTSVSFGPEGRVVVGANVLGIFIWDSATGRELNFFSLRPTTSALLHPVTGDLLAIAGIPQSLYRWPRQTAHDDGSLAFRFGPPHWLDLPGRLGRCAMEPSGSRAAVVHEDHIHLVDLKGSTNHSILPFKGRFDAVAISAGGKWLVTREATRNEVEVWALDGLQAESTPVEVIHGSRHFAFSPDGRLLMTCWERQCHLWDTHSWREYSMPFSALESGDAPGAMAFAPVGRNGEALLAVANSSVTIKLYKLDVESSPPLIELATLENPERRPLLALAFNPDGSRLAATTADQTIQVWNLAGICDELTRMKLGGALPTFATKFEGPLTVVLATNLPDSETPRKWQDVERLSGTLGDTLHLEPGSVLPNLLQRGRLYLDLGRPLKAKQDFENALSLDPDDAAARELLQKAKDALKQQTTPLGGENPPGRRR